MGSLKSQVQHRLIHLVGTVYDLSWVLAQVKQKYLFIRQPNWDLCTLEGGVAYRHYAGFVYITREELLRYMVLHSS